MFTGCILTILAGAMQGAFPLPMKYATKWKWENIWSVFALWGFVILPWLLAFMTIPDLINVYTSTSLKTIAAITFFGAGWGIGTICFGIGVSTVGLALGFAVIIGLGGALGTLLPMVLFHADAFRTSGGQTILGGVVLMLIGVCLCALAGNWKEKALSALGGNETGSKRSGTFFKGLTVCIISGVASPMLNFAFVFGEEIISNAKKTGAAPENASNPIWCWTMSSAFVITFLYCLYLMRKDQGWSRYVLKGAGLCWVLTFLMGILWSGSIAIYGMGLSKLGLLAASIGWPILMITSIVMGNLCGLVTGEWKGAGSKPLMTMATGLAVLIIAICLIGMGNT
ncbi:MAG: hypothetical protein A2283_21235 [Lentisphaerae bacterium RIFOXYA12_FULL_48_11]|nr:MAG: hypothetical protein A2283_21235 [Lentisphaerae bacterium RIFOXYA12_FULL_48_11]